MFHLAFFKPFYHPEVFLRNGKFRDVELITSQFLETFDDVVFISVNLPVHHLWGLRFVFIFSIGGDHIERGVDDHGEVFRLMFKLLDRKSFWQYTVLR